MTATQPLLAIPPFPGAKPIAFAAPGVAAEIDCEAILQALVRHRVGGCYWGRQAKTVAVLDQNSWALDADPWHLLDHARAVDLPADDPRCVLALAAGKSLTLHAPDGSPCPLDRAAIVQRHLGAWEWRDPFDGRRISILEAIALCGFWRELIDSNRPLQAALGFAHWKRPTVAPLLWGGQPKMFTGGVPALPKGAKVAVWRSRLSKAQAKAVAEWDVSEVEDGFLRSVGLGADCVPPLSIIVDAEGVHFDPSRPSRLEHILQNGQFTPELLERAATLRHALQASGLSKYERAGPAQLPRPGGTRRHVLVPGQVEDDRAVTNPGALSSNLDLLRRARADVGPDAFVIYKPHPDVLAGHRVGAIRPEALDGVADMVETTAPMAALIDMVDELHVNTSLAGMEALLRGKPVTVHGVPAYAGWGLTRDLGPVPKRRTARRSIDELVAAAYLLYPRYLDPETGLPCPAEVLVQRLSAGAPSLAPKARSIVAIRRASGQLRKWLAD